MQKLFTINISVGDWSSLRYGANVQYTTWTTILDGPTWRSKHAPQDTFVLIAFAYLEKNAMKLNRDFDGQAPVQEREKWKPRAHMM